MVEKISSGITTVQLSGKNRDGRPNLKIFLSRKLSSSLGLSPGIRVGYTMWLIDSPTPAEPTRSDLIPPNFIESDPIPEVSNLNEEEEDFLHRLKYAPSNNVSFIIKNAEKNFGVLRTKGLLKKGGMLEKSGRD